ncbi:MAG TPA: sulfotransferase [Steroidobacteraceae bacterium]|jgi:tetratricopeptide (TPR) repeat protein|nr:sulfotransferase [Steroidobacteraceae bacterium]
MTASALDIEGLVLSAHAALDAGDSSQAEALCRQALALAPRHARALELIGALEMEQRRFGEAVPVFELLCTVEPDQSAHWFNFANSLREVGDADRSLEAFACAAARGERSADFYYNLGLTHMARGDFAAAKAVLEDALKLEPGDAEILHRYVLSCYECMQFERALAALDNWTPSATAPAETVAAIAQVLLNLGEDSRAESLIRSAICGNQNAGALLVQVQIFERTNRVAEAAALLERVASLPEAQSMGSDFLRVSAKIAQRRSDHALAIELYRRALADYSQLHDRHFILFSLAESLHALERYDETVLTLLDAHRSQAAFIRRSRPIAGLRGTPEMAVTEFSCDPADIAIWDHTGAPPAVHSPIFVVGFPRSGTTLLELTLDAHPMLRSMDEQPFVQNALEDILAKGITYPERLGALTRADLDELRARYYERVRKKAPLDQGQRVVDKNPLNILRLPVIRRVFPNSPILLIVRHPCDVILSCFMQHFRAPDFAMLCSEMPSLTLGYRKTFDFWYDQAALLSPRVLEVRYESFVSDFGIQVRRIAEFLELPWDSAMLEPAERARSKGYISTPSYSQVVQPVTQKAVGRWHAYRKYLEPALPVLAPYLQRWGYDG